MCVELRGGDGKPLINKTVRHVHDLDNAGSILHDILNCLPGFRGFEYSNPNISQGQRAQKTTKCLGKSSSGA